MSAHDTLNDLSKLNSVQDALMTRLEDELREIRAASEDIDAFISKAITANAARTAMMIEARHAHDEATKVFSFAKVMRTRLRLVQ